MILSFLKHRNTLAENRWKFSFPNLKHHIAGRDSSVGIVTRIGLEGPGDQILVGAVFSTPVRNGLRAHPALRAFGTGSISGGGENKTVGAWC